MAQQIEAPDGFSLYIRAYWGKPPILDGSWQPPTIVKTSYILAANRQPLAAHERPATFETTNRSRNRTFQ